ncbi:AraC family transcriptional regulator [Agaribacter marinus]|uniref:Cupin n=1 Tax=Agaribacter marinus TaxID=1431249 RepID=A0AA37WJB0_9ALTE|nr:AraC family transcriptional regulator [Agaribacter marinus]GLR69530.1 cupin [Agaribacter marinus]
MTETLVFDVTIPRRDVGEAIWVNSFSRLQSEYKLIHRHREYEICFCPDDVGTYFINDREYDIAPGDIFIVNGNEYHQPILKNPENNGALVIYFDPESIPLHARRFSWVHAFLHSSNYGLNRIGKHQEITSLMLSLQDAFESKKPNWAALSWGILSHILVLIEDHILSNDERFFRSSIVESQTRFNKVIAFIKQNLHTTICLERLYGISGLSKSQFSLQFKKNFNCTTTQYICRERCNRAAALLKGSNNNISEVAYLCGFESLSYFNRQFRKRYQMSPTQFRSRY